MLTDAVFSPKETCHSVLKSIAAGRRVVRDFLRCGGVRLENTSTRVPYGSRSKEMVVPWPWDASAVAGETWPVRGFHHSVCIPFTRNAALNCWRKFEVLATR